MAKTIGQQLQNLDSLSANEVKVADEKHTLSLADKSEELRIVLTRPLTICRSKEIEKVSRLVSRNMRPQFCLHYKQDQGLNLPLEILSSWVTELCSLIN